ncbi:arginase [Opitutaceae bacterium EW11]|nr:arginase [Opitutaceae bacterium EW11]
MSINRTVVIEAPSSLGLELDGAGVAQLSGALLAAGLADSLLAPVAAHVPAPSPSSERHPEHGILNADALARYSIALADAVGAALGRGEFPVVLGGDCSILLGNLLALRRRGRYGLLFLDGHADFYQPEANVNGEAASSELAFATGRGPEALTRFEMHRRLVEDADVVVLGFRDGDEQRHYGSQPLPSSILAFDLAEVRRAGLRQVLTKSMAHLKRQEVAGIWIHLDADVLDDGVMPAVKYRLPGGLAGDEVTEVLRMALASGLAAGLEVTIYDPTLDPARKLAPCLVEMIARGFSEQGRG